MLMVNKVLMAHYSPLKGRKVEMQKQLDSLGIKCEWFEQEPTSEDINLLLDPSESSWHFKNNVVGYTEIVPHKILNRAEISLAFKHIKMYEYIVEHNISTSLILEDDAVFCDSFVNDFNFNLINTPKDWDFIFIGSGCNLRINPSRLIEGKVAYIKEHPASKCTDSYLITLEAAKRVLETINPFSFPIDFELNYQMALHHMRVYWWEPPIVTQGSQCGLYNSEIQQ